MADITVNFVEVETTVNVDMTRLSWRDLVTLQRAQKSGLTEDQAIETITELVSKLTGQDAWELPAQVVSQIASQLVSRSTLAADAKN
jgi:H2-forming N5,N10-methylenetetrahydromethanopterin dehydrogenase-like enzyme